MLFKKSLCLMVLLIAGSVEARSPGQIAPQIIGRNIDDSLFALSRSGQQPKVVNFFWVNCKPCKKEIPLLATKAEQYPHVTFIVVHAEENPDTQTNYDIEDIRRFAKSLTAHPKNLLLGSPRLKKDYGIKGFPSTYLLSADNKIEKVIVGFNRKTVATLQQWLEAQK